MTDLTEKQKATELIYDGHILHVYKDTVTLPNGDEAFRELIRHVGAVAVVALTDDGKVILERQYRYPLGRVVTEIPAGKLDSKSEDRLLAAKREFREETGYTADEWISLGDYSPAAAYTDERITIYLAKGLHRGEQELDEDEFLEFYFVPLNEAAEKCIDGTITDGKTIAGILRAKYMLAPYLKDR